MESRSPEVSGAVLTVELSQPEQVGARAELPDKANTQMQTQGGGRLAG